MQALSIQQLKKTYRNGHQALKGVDLAVEPGDFFALLGPNGAGKSTLIGIISSLVTKSSGTVSIFGHDLDQEMNRAKRCIGLVPQEVNFNQFETVQNVVLNQAGYYGMPGKLAKMRAEFCLKQMELWEKRDSASRRLSGGMKRRLMIARAMVHEPKLLILDEPTAGVDIEIRRAMWQMLQEVNQQGTTIILTTHYLEEAESLCRNIAIIDDGRIIERSPMNELLARMHTEVFILDLQSPLATLPQIDGFEFERVDQQSVQVSVPKSLGLSALFEHLNARGIQVSSMRNKANRLEQLFVDLLQ